jgi:hypothetical protein
MRKVENSAGRSRTAASSTAVMIPRPSSVVRRTSAGIELRLAEEDVAAELGERDQLAQDAPRGRR